MNTLKRHRRAWAAIPAIVLIVAISVIAGPSANAAYTTQVPTVTLNVGSAVQIPVAVVTIPRLSSTSTSREYEEFEPLNFVQGFVLGVTLVLIGGLLMLSSRRSV